MRITRYRVVALIALTLLATNLSAAHAATSTLNVASTTTSATTIDNTVDWASTSSSTTWANAYGADAWWGTTTNGGATSTAFISCDANKASTHCANTTVYYRLRFILPADYSSPSVSIKYLVDNSGSITLNGYTMSGSSNSGGSGAVITTSDSTASHFVVGVNTILFVISDSGAPTGFGYAAVISATTSGTVSLVTPTTKVTPTLSWADVTKVQGNPTFTVTDPTVVDGISGSFTYASSNSGVMSVSGSNLTPGTPGAATITATFTPTSTLNYSTATITMTATVLSNVPTATLSYSGNPIYRSIFVLRVTPSVAGKVTFYALGKAIPQCKNLVSAATQVSCSWKPAIQNLATIKSVFTPTDSSYVAVTSSANLRISPRQTQR